MSLKPGQLQMIHTAKRQLDWSEPQYRMVLKSAGRVDSAKDLDNVSFEDVMAVAEDQGFRMPNKPENYFRGKVERRGTLIDAREVYVIERLAVQTQYQLPSLCKRFSHGRTIHPSKLQPGEAWNLIEMLKAVIARESPRAAQQSSLFGG